LSSCHAAFFGCNALVELDLSNWDVSNVSQCYWMFELCTSLVELDLSNWKLKDSVNAGSMFYRCKNLNYIILNNSNYTTANIVIDKLLSRSEADPGVLRIAKVNNVSQVNMNLAKSKNWDIRITKPGPSKVESKTFNSGASNGKKISSKSGNGHIVKIIFNK
jgi:surface protein